MPAATSAGRSTGFREDPHSRFWWHKLAATDYVPALYANLREDEWAVMAGWFAETGRRGRVAEINVPAMALVTGLITGNGIGRVVQLGHYYGYSALLLGFALRATGVEGPALVTVDIDRSASAFTLKWIKAAGLAETVSVHTGDSADPALPALARRLLGGPPEIVLVDSSHAYEHTLRELDLWAPQLPPNALLLLHDASVFAQDFDPTAAGGVHRAIDEWLAANPAWSGMTLNGAVAPGADGDALVYKDACGLGILQRRATSSVALT
ncbi:MAG TPA: class I SAM-dependent methyltransferase [Solirubrobacteraceae bacterium]|nr:class I SAM-dependent methyltransferase [Solirubrobacteraceae bacterium]